MSDPKEILLRLSPVKLDLLIEALDSHRWRRADEKYRDGWEVIEPGSDDPERLGELVASQELIDELEALRPKPESTLPLFDDDFTSGGGGNFAWKYRGKGYVHVRRTRDVEPACQTVLNSKLGDAPDRVLDATNPANDLSEITCPGCKHVLGIEPCGQHEGSR